MVGVPTSNRCDTCRKRKKKCGQQKPSCLECVRSGWACPGYKTRWKFVDEAPKLAEHYAERKYVYDLVDRKLEGKHSRRVFDQDVRLDGSVVVRKGVQGSHYNTFARSEVPRYVETNLLGSAIAYCIESKVKGVLIPLRLVGSFFDFIPARLGNNAALDDAVSCLCSIYCGAPSALDAFPRRVYQAYVRALGSLRSCVSDESTRMESETLCASILLQMCELVVNIDRGAWSDLARGTTLLLYSRGVHRYDNAFDHAMLDSQLNYILAQSMTLREHCFLCSPEWRALLFQRSIWPHHASQPRSLSLRSRLSSILLELPSLIIYCSTVDESDKYRVGWEERLDMLINKASRMLGNLKEWLSVEVEPLLLSHASTQKVTQEQIIYPDIISGVLDCVANSALLTVHKILRSLCHARLQFTGQQQEQLEIFTFLEDPGAIEGRRQRAIKAFEFVREESKLAAKPLEFGLRQIRISGSH